MQTNTSDTKPASAILETGEKIPFNQRSKHPVVNFVLLWAVFFGIFGVIWWLGEVGLRVKATVLINDLGLMFIAIATMVMAAGAAWLVLLKERKEGLR